MQPNSCARLRFPPRRSSAGYPTLVTQRSIITKPGRFYVYPTMATLIGRIKQQTVARHRNEKVSVSPNLILDSSKKKEKERQVQPA